MINVDASSASDALVSTGAFVELVSNVRSGSVASNRMPFRRSR